MKRQNGLYPETKTSADLNLANVVAQPSRTCCAEVAPQSNLRTFISGNEVAP